MYHYDEMKPDLFTDEGQRDFLKVRDHVNKLLRDAGAITMEAAIKVMSLQLIKEPAKEYHAKAREHLSSHQLIAFQRCPALYDRMRRGLWWQKDTPAKALGRVVHVAVLEGGDELVARYASDDDRPMNPSTGKAYGSDTKKYAEWADAQGKEILSGSTMSLVGDLSWEIMSHPVASELINGGTPEGVVRFAYSKECPILCQSRLDYWRDDVGIIDLKTCDDIDRFELSCRKYKYANQLAFYQTSVHRTIGQWCRVHIVAVETSDPYRVGVWEASTDTLVRARRENDAAVVRMMECVETGEWPTGYETKRILELY